MSTSHIESVNDLRQALPTFTTNELLAEAQFTFGYYGNAVVNGQFERSDDAVERFNAVKDELARRLATN